MILKGNQRGGGRQMALHLLNGENNEHVDVHQVRGFIADDVLGALNEAYALSKGTKCKQFMYSLSLSPPLEQSVPATVFEEALARIEKKLGLEEQPRVIVFHEKEGRRHAHCVWSRIDINEMKAINIAHDRRKLNTLAKSLYLENGWKMPEGFKGKNKSNPLNFTRAEWEQAKRIGRKASDIKAELQECWAISDSKKSFEAALKEDGYYLAKGDKRSYVVMDLRGEIYSLPRQLGLKKSDLAGRLGKPETLPDINQTKTKIAKSLSPLYLKYRDELAVYHKTQSEKLLKEKMSMRAHHRKIREDLKAFQDKRWQQEENQRAARVRHGFKGLWDKLSGRYWKTRKQNEQEAYAAYSRDQKQKEELITKHLTQRQELQTHIKQLHEAQLLEQKNLVKDFSHIKLQEEITSQKTATNELDQSLRQDYDAPELEM